jgi:hypothetical protein
MLFPITFSIPESKIVSLENDNVKKTKFLSSIIPGKLETYIYNSEEDYYNEYKESIFAITTKKGGWDCLRHYEIMANGCIPYFPNIENCPEYTMALLPKNLIRQGNMLCEKIIRNENNEITEEDKNKCNILIKELINYTKEYLTCKKMAEYILKKTNKKNIKKILYLSGDPDPDYLKSLTLIGFKELLGKECHDYPKIEHIYKNDIIDYKKLYGKGFTYSNILDNELHNNEYDKNIEEYILNKKYDLIIYGSYIRGIPYYDLIETIYEPNKIIMLCGEDKLCNYRELFEKGFNIFVRELL